MFIYIKAGNELFVVVKTIMKLLRYTIPYYLHSGNHTIQFVVVRDTYISVLNISNSLCPPL